MVDPDFSFVIPANCRAKQHECYSIVIAKNELFIFNHANFGNVAGNY